VAGVWTSEEYAAIGLPAPADEARAGDVIVEAAPGYMLVEEARGDDEHGVPKYRGNHGQRPDYADNHALFLAAGRGLKRGVTLGRITSRDVAPTLSTLLGLAPASAEGRVLTEILA